MIPCCVFLHTLYLIRKHYQNLGASMSVWERTNASSKLIVNYGSKWVIKNLLGRGVEDSPLLHVPDTDEHRSCFPIISLYQGIHITSSKTWFLSAVYVLCILIQPGILQHIHQCSLISFDTIIHFDHMKNFQLLAVNCFFLHFIPQ